MLHAFRESVGKWVAIGILGLIAVTFIFFGIDFSVTQSPFAAKVNGTNIPMLEFERELQLTQQQYQEQLRVELTDDLRRVLRRNVVDQMVMREALRQHADDVGYFVSDQQLAESIRNTPAFRVGDQFSADTYNALLRANGMTPALYEEQQRAALAMVEFQDGITASTFLTPAEFRSYIELTAQQRDIAYTLFEATAFIDQVEIDDSEVAEFHAANPSRYMTPETVDIEYVELGLADIAATIEITEADLREYYEENQERFETAEERSVSHILFTVDGDDYQSAEAEVQAALERLEAGEDFAALAAELSDDGGTSGNGGSLGWISRGVLAGPFEDALYSMELGEVEGPVETEFGYHILKLDDIRRGEIQTFEAVRDQLQTELSTDRANSIFYDRANKLRQAAFDAYDELTSVAADSGLELESIDGFQRTGNADPFPNVGAVVARVFSEEAIVSGRNSDLIELTDDDVIIVRVRAHHDPEPQPLEEVAEEIREELRMQAAQGLVREAASAFAAALPERMNDPEALAEELGGTWERPGLVGRTDANVPPEVLAAAFSEPRSNVLDPVTRQVPLRSGDEAVLVLTGVEAGTPDAIPVDERNERQRLLADEMAQLEISAYAINVRDEASVRVPDEVLNPQF